VITHTHTRHRTRTRTTAHAAHTAHAQQQLNVRSLHALLEFGNHPRVKLYGDDLLHQGQHLHRKIARTGTNLQHHVGGLQLGLHATGENLEYYSRAIKSQERYLCDNSFNDLGILEQVLTKALVYVRIER
jgi:hypothetical protein